MNFDPYPDERKAAQDGRDFVSKYVDMFILMSSVGINSVTNQVQLCKALIESDHTRDEFAAAFASAVALLAEEALK